MRTLQFFGIAVGLAILVYGIYKRRFDRTSRLDLLVSLILSFGLITLSVFPSIVDIPARLLGMQTRWFTALFLSNLVLFWLFLYTFNQANASSRALGDLVRSLAREEYVRRFDRKDDRETVYIIIPAYNEEKSIGSVLATLPHEVLGYNVCPLVVVDGADDQTEQIVRMSNVYYASHIINRGQGDALRTGFDISLRENASIVMTMDSDGQHRAEDIEILLRPILNDQADFVMGSRFLGNYDDKGSARHLGIIFFTKLINALAGTNISDCTNGFRAIRASCLMRLDLRESRFNAPELIMEAARNGVRITEVPCTIARRSAGESKKPRRLGYPLGFIKTIFRVWLR